MEIHAMGYLVPEDNSFVLYRNQKTKIKKECDKHSPEGNLRLKILVLKVGVTCQEWDEPAVTQLKD